MSWCSWCSFMQPKAGAFPHAKHGGVLAAAAGPGLVHGRPEVRGDLPRGAAGCQKGK